MGQVLHGCATTTEAIRRATQNSQASLRALPKRYGINQKTVAKWRKRTSVADLPTGPKEPKSTMLSIEEEAIIVAFRKHTLLPLDDCLYSLQATIPHLTRSSLHRCLQRHDIFRLPEVEGDKPARKKFKPYPIGYFHIDIAEVQTAEGKLYLYVAVDRTSKFAFVQLVRKTGRTSSSAFLIALIAAVPYKIHTVLTDNGIQFIFPLRIPTKSPEDSETKSLTPPNLISPGARRSARLVLWFRQAAWSIWNRSWNLFFLLLRCSGHVGNALAVSKRSGMSRVPRAQACRAHWRVWRKLSPERSSRWALWTRRSTTTSA